MQRGREWKGNQIAYSYDPEKKIIIIVRKGLSGRRKCTRQLVTVITIN